MVLDTKEVNYKYDGLGRLINRNINNSFNTEYEYVANGKRTSSLVKSIKNGDDKFSYKYDKLNNITDVHYNNNLIRKYYYDNINELIKEDDLELKKQTEYTYDSNGNILTKVISNMEDNLVISTDTYTYGNSNWEDQLTKFNDQEITYDMIGNPLTIGNNIKLSWINGRSLNSYQDTSKNLNVTYKYNQDGIRISKKVNDIETKYYLEGNRIIYEKRGNNLINYLYDSTGILGLVYNNDVYYYIKNLQGDIIGLLDSTYNKIVSYEYDSWGKVLSVKDNEGNIIIDSNNIGIINPFRYRGYYYDEETSLYYLNSRYYNPNWCRFVNADGIIGANQDILSYNLYTYVSNNPVFYKDETGEEALAAGLALGILNPAAIEALTVSAIGIVKVTLALAGSLVIADTISKAISKESNSNKKEKKKTVIYRYGNFTNHNLTPRKTIDNNGLSYFTSPPLKGNYSATTVEDVNNTGVLRAERDASNPSHYLIVPVNRDNMIRWQATREMANEHPHKYTVLLKSISWYSRDNMCERG